jgi:ribosomal protein S18 acetylase RimI-like enzyme
MQTEFRRAVVPREVRSLIAFDHKAFPRSDWFAARDWEHYESYWLCVGARKIGCCAFEAGVDFADDVDETNRRSEGSLYIASTGILPAFQGKGFGRLMKSWHIAYAIHYGYRRVVTNTRSRNAAMIALNKKFGFRVLRTTPGYYGDPVDATVVMERVLR